MIKFFMISKYFDPIVVKNELKLQKPAILLFSAEWCGPCRTYYNSPMRKKIQEWCIANQVNFFYLNIDEVPDIAEYYKIKSIPSITIINLNGFLPPLQAQNVTLSLIEDILLKQIK